MRMECCRSSGHIVGNTFFDYEVEHQVTYFNLITHPMQSITIDNFTQLNLMLVPKSWLHLIKYI